MELGPIKYEATGGRWGHGTVSGYPFTKPGTWADISQPWAQDRSGPEWDWLGGDPQKRDHTAVDVAVTTDVYVPVDGVVIQKQWDTRCGNKLVIKVLDGSTIYYLVYCHLEAPSPLTVSKHVKRGDLAGNAGTTGASSGDHLHFGVWTGGKSVDPVQFFTEVPSQSRAALSRQIFPLVWTKNYDAKLEGAYIVYTFRVPA